MSDTVDLQLLGRGVQELRSEMRSLKRDMAMLRAQQSELPTLVQFQAGLDAIDARITELQAETLAVVGRRQDESHAEIMAAIGELHGIVRTIR